MTTLVKIHRKGQMTLPTRLRALAGIAEGDLVEAAFSRGKIVITPKIGIDRSQFPNADGEYTPAQRKIVDARLDRAVEEVRQCRVSPAFETVAEFATALKAEVKKLTSKSKRTARR